MRIIIDCEPELLDGALLLVSREVTDFAKYDRIGWGWSHGPAPFGARFFVRRLKDGLSIKQLGDRP